jgi:hypothetical protein
MRHRGLGLQLKSEEDLLKEGIDLPLRASFLQSDILHLPNAMAVLRDVQLVWHKRLDPLHKRLKVLLTQ